MDMDLSTLSLGFILGVVCTSLLVRLSIAWIDTRDRWLREAEIRARAVQEAREINSRPLHDIPRPRNRTMWDEPLEDADK